MVALLGLGVLHGYRLLLLHLLLLLLMLLLCLLCLLCLRVGLCLLLLGVCHGRRLLGITRLLLLDHGLLLGHLLAEVWREVNVLLWHVSLERGHLLRVHLVLKVHSGHAILLCEHLLLLMLLPLHEGLLLGIPVLRHEGGVH